MKKRTTKKAKPFKRVTRSYVVTFRLNVEQDETDEDKVFDVENSIRIDLECLKGEGCPSGLVKYLDIEEVGAIPAEEEGA